MLSFFLILLYNLSFSLQSTVCYSALLQLVLNSFRHDNGSSGADIFTAYYLNGPGMSVYNPFHNGKPKTGSTCFSCTRFIGPIKPIKYIRNIIWIYTDTIVLYRNSYKPFFFIVCINRNNNFPVLRRIFDTVIH